LHSRPSYDAKFDAQFSRKPAKRVTLASGDAIACVRLMETHVDSRRAASGPWHQQSFI